MYVSSNEVSPYLSFVQLRERDQEFPDAIGKEVETAQPFHYPHVDFTPAGASLKLGAALGPSFEERLEQPVDILK